LIVAASATRIAHAGPVERLSRTLLKSKSEKARISAAVSLARLKNRRAVPVLIKALNDRSESVRAIAATALGHLGDKRALKALRAATNDRADMVRRRAVAAIDRIEKRPKATKKVKRRRNKKLGRIRMDAQEAPLRRARPELHVTVKSAADKSRGRARKKTRKARARRMKTLMMKEMKGTGSVTVKAAVAKKLGLQSFAIDASIMKLDRNVRGKFVEVECEIRVTISNGRGRMISFLTGGAKVQVPRTTYRRQYLAQMRREALENAVQNVYRDVLSFLRRTAKS